MPSYFLKIGTFLFSFVLSIVYLCHTGGAQSEEEMKTIPRPTGSIRGSYGEKDTQDYRAEVSGTAGPVGYYVFAGRQDSHGLRPSRNFDNHSVYSKLHIPLSRDVDVGVSIGYSDPEIGLGDFPSGDITAAGASRTFFTAASLDASLTRELGLNVSFHRYKQKSALMNDVLGLGLSGPPGELYLDTYRRVLRRAKGVGPS